MGNFRRALRLTLTYKLTLAGALACALAVAVLWGGNIGAVYPMVEVCIHGKTMHQWVDEKIAATDQQAGVLRGDLDKLKGQLNAQPTAARGDLARRIATASARLEAEERAAEQYRWLKPIIARWLPGTPFKTLGAIVAFLLVCTLVKDALQSVGSVLVDRLAQLATFDLRKEFYRRTLRMDVSSFGDSGTSDILSRFTYDLDSVAAGIQTFFGRAVREPLKMLACLIGAAWVSWRLLLLSLVLAPVAAFLISQLARTLKRANRKALEQMSSLYNVLVETFGGIKAVKAFTMERHERRRFHAASKQYYRRAMRIAFFDALVGPVTEVMGIVTISLAILFGAYLAMNQKTEIFGITISQRPLDLGQLFVFFGMLVGASDPARRLTDVFNRLQRAVAASDRVYQMLDREPTITSPKNALRIARHHRTIAFEGVSFGYGPEQLVLEGIDLEISFGQTVAIVGPNGCGKTTLANLVPRFYDPTKGTVRLDGHDLRELRLSDLRRQIGVVTQETLLFDDTVFNNIRYGAPHAKRDEVIEAAKRAHAHKFISERLDHGYETMAGAQGSKLSGGQRQRIALARAILRDPAILILDEATSQVDLESEQLIQKVLEQFTRNRTAIVITHRLATLALADTILVMQAGRIIDRGPHEQLMARCDFYRRLHSLGFKETA